MAIRFRDELSERDLLEVAHRICSPLHLKPEELQCDTETHASKAITAARKAFAEHLLGAGWSLAGIARLLNYEGHSSLLHVLGRKRRPHRPRPLGDPCAAGTGGWSVFAPGRDPEGEKT